jgi:tetratricopeptide (TPR) repeat protein
MLEALRQCTKIIAKVPDHKLALAVFEHQGLVSQHFQNWVGSIKAFQRMRDVAEDCEDRQQEMKAYVNMTNCLQLSCDYKLAIKSAKRFLQIAWYLNDFRNELFAYELLAR